ncbi:hypothetical protein Pla22_40370 [Rubripirellula amarantea]|uniref:Uncharacterized protein n=1 Tax=Rubripirellula amarantea TaxID=2527999 RepID=A0A5C5WKR2_9BACT|nr:hypothetical protein [Rubripirellula amarantea]TWT51260.1 hypothetical protein Pla22_40370 [Rubripirellula amarantea]
MPAIPKDFRSSFQRLGDPIFSLIEAAPMPSLGEGPDVPAIAQQVRAIQSNELSAPEQTAELVRSAMWLLAGDLDRSHDISQSIETADGSLLHGIMHRREGDFSNAKYWFRRVGDHEVLQSLSQNEGGYDDPFEFVNDCQSALRKNDEQLISRCEQVQWTEWTFVMHHLLTQ